MSSSPAPRRAAFFDVDETLLAFPSVWRFLAHWLARHSPDPRAELRRTREAFRARTAAGTPREQLMQDWARLFAGRSAAELADDGGAWFRSEQAAGQVFVPSVLAALTAHAARGDLVVLVSGSVPACLDPVARAVAADVVLCSRPMVRDGVLTGELDVTLIGAAKAAAVTALAAEQGLALADCSAYGDHASDLPLLALVGDPVAVGDDPGITAVADASGWRRLRTDAAPAHSAA